jgi:NAD(P)-dependent dehydrogenase (short-subunit alcohol dehydrogenase family)
MDPRTAYPQPPFPARKQPMPGETRAMEPSPDHGEESYKGSWRLTGKAALITGADSGIGRAVAIAFAREGADVLLSYLDEQTDAEETARWVIEAGRRAVPAPGDISEEAHCKALVGRTFEEFGKIDILVSNAAFQASQESIEEIRSEEWDHTFRTNVYAYFYLVKAAVGHMKPGESIIATSSINAKIPSPQLLAYATTKGAIANLTAGLAQSLAEKGIRVNCVGPGPVWTPLIPSTMSEEKVKDFGKTVPLERPAQPVDSDGSSYITGAYIPVSGRRPTL